MARIGFVGTGEIANAMVRGIAGDGHAILVSERNAGIAAALARDCADVSVAPNDRVVAESDIVILCLGEKVARAVLPDLPFRAGQRIVSVMLGLSLAELAELCAPAGEIAITIPLPFIETGGCPLPHYPGSSALDEVFGARNVLLPLSAEAALNPHFAATALSSVVLAQLDLVSDWLAEFTGDRQSAEAYMVTLIAGGLGNVPNDGEGRLAEAIKALSIEGGLNATLRAHMKESGAMAGLRDGLDAFRPRLGLPPKSEGS